MARTAEERKADDKARYCKKKAKELAKKEEDEAKEAARKQRKAVTDKARYERKKAEMVAANNNSNNGYIPKENIVDFSELTLEKVIGSGSFGEVLWKATI